MVAISTCGLTVRRVGQLAAGQGEVGELDQGVGELLGAGADVPGAAAGLQDGLQRRVDLFPADGVEVEPAAAAAVGVPGDVQAPVLGRVGFGAVGVQRGQVVVHHLGEAVISLPDRDAASTRSISVRSTPSSAAAARLAGVVIGAMIASWSAVIPPATQAAATAGRWGSARPLRTSRPAARGARWPCPRSQEAIVFSPSCSGA